MYDIQSRFKTVSIDNSNIKTIISILYDLTCEYGNLFYEKPLECHLFIGNIVKELECLNRTHDVETALEMGYDYLSCPILKLIPININLYAEILQNLEPVNNRIPFIMEIYQEDLEKFLLRGFKLLPLNILEKLDIIHSIEVKKWVLINDAIRLDKLINIGKKIELKDKELKIIEEWQKTL